MWRGIIMRKQPYIRQYISVSNIYVASSIKQDLIFLYSNTCGFIR